MFQDLDCAGAFSVGVLTGAAGAACASPAQTAVVGLLVSERSDTCSLGAGKTFPEVCWLKFLLYDRWSGGLTTLPDQVLF